MNIVLLLLHALMGDPDVVLPTPEDYQALYCQYHTHPVCGDVVEPEEPEADVDAKDTGMLT